MSDPTPRRWVIVLPWLAPPLSMNDRSHWRAAHRSRRTVRLATALAVRAAGVPPLRRCEVLLEYAPRDRRRRDADNLVATLKVCCDGVVDAGVVRDDTPDLMRKPMPVLLPPAPGGRLRLVVTEVTGGQS